jgi:mRNA-degrading endonuclease toxin of MazEF toxin-antitoxin module
VFQDCIQIVLAFVNYGKSLNLYVADILIIEQFSVWLVRLEKKPVGHEQGGDRPFLVISTTSYNQHSKTPIGFFLSTSEKKAKNNYSMRIEKMSDELSSVNLSQIRTLDISRFVRKETIIQAKEGREIIRQFVVRMTGTSEPS